MFEFTIKAEAKSSSARIADFITPHGVIETPVFMPVGTKASVKSLSPDDLEEINVQIVLANTYHLYLRPGVEVIEKMGGIHSFMNWKRPVLTDSGGFQIFSLGSNFTLHKALPKKINPQKKLVKVYDEGVEFRSVLDGSKHFFSPEKVMEIEHGIGADLIMAFDECPSYGISQEYTKISLQRTHNWMLSCKKKYEELQKISKRKQALIPIIQGGIYKNLRKESAKFMTQLNLPAIAIGGLAVGEPRELTWEMIDSILPYLPKNKPRYIMGIGTPEDITEAVSRGIDMFDCVLPTRLGRHGQVFTSYGRIHIANKENRLNEKPIDENCSCTVCKNYSRAYLRHLIIEKELLGLHLLSYHNVAFLTSLVNNLKKKIHDENNSLSIKNQ